MAALQIKVHSPASLFLSRWMDSPSSRLTVLHYVGYDQDAGGILSAVRALALENRFDCVLGVNAAFSPRRPPGLPLEICPWIDGERLGLKTFWRARAVAAHLTRWLNTDVRRRLHLHSRAGLATAWWLSDEALSRTAISVHCLGRQRWFYRASARKFGGKLFWLHPAMRGYYGLGEPEDHRISSSSQQASRGHRSGASRPSIDSSGSDDELSWTQCIPSPITNRPPPRMKTRLRMNEGRVAIGGIGALAPWKRWDLVLDALLILDDSTRAAVSFRHLGANDGTPASQRYEAVLRAHRANAHAQVRWEGGQPSSDGFLESIDCLVVPSDEEPLSLAMLEALRAGVPVLRADSGGGLDAILPDRNGWLFRTGDANDLATHLWRLINSDALAQTRYAPEAFQRYLASEVSARWLEVYTRVERAERK